MGSLFFSHSSLDQAAAQDLANRLEAEGFVALFLDFDPDRGIPAGRSWERELYGQLRRTDALIFLATSASTASRWCFAEVSLARSLGKPVFPVCFENGAEMPLLDDVQWVNITDKGGAFDRLLGGLRRAGLDPSDSFGWDPMRPPYPGLEPFKTEDAAVFFGRQREVDRLLELLQPTLYRDAGRAVAIMGPSGSGKSSLLFAGLLPRLTRLDARWLLLPPFTPGADPVEGLAQSLAVSFAAHGSARDSAELKTVLDGGSAGLVELVGELVRLGSPQRKVLLVVDQAEELITRSGIADQRAFLGLLGGALKPGSPLWAIITGRSEFLSPRPERAGLTEIVDDLLLVEPLSRGRLAEVIQGPARLGGLEFAPGLSERIVEETTGGDALPLLAYTLRELYGRAGKDGLITTAEYEAAGGVVGALQRTADRLLDELVRRGRGRLVMPTLLKLATVEGGSEPARRTLARRALSAEEQVVVDTFTEARLLTSSNPPGGQTIVSVAHEALLRQWAPLREAIEAERSSLQTRSDLERLAADWDRAAHDGSYLLRGGHLSEIDAWAAEHGDDLNPLEQSFVEASRRSAAGELETARRTNRRLRGLAVGLGVVLIGAVLAGALALQSSREAESQSRLALSRVLATQADRLLERQPDVAILVGLQSLSLARDEEPEPRVPAALVAGLARQTHSSRLLAGHSDQVHEVAYSSQGDMIASAGWDGTIRFWDARTGRARGQPIRAGQGKLTALAYSPDGRFVASGGEHATVQVWDTRSRRRSAEPSTGHQGTVYALAFSPSGELLASAGQDGTVRLWNADSGRLRQPVLRGHGQPVRDVEFSRDGQSVATAGEDESARVWDVSTGEQVGPPLRGHREDVWGVAFSPDGEVLATASADKTVGLWSLPSGRSLGRPLSGHAHGAWDAAFSPDGKVIATGGGDRTVRLWDVATRRPLDQPLRGHTASVKDVEFSPDGRRIASAAWDGTVRLWDVADTFAFSRTLTGHAGAVIAVRSSPNGGLLASADENGELRLWRLPSARPLGSPQSAHKAEVNALAFSPDGELLATGSADGTARLWELPDLQPHGPPLALHREPVSGVAFSPDASLLATASWDRTVRIWDVSTARPKGFALRHREIVNGVAFSPKGRLLATASADGIAQLWDLATRRKLGGALEGHDNEVFSVSFSPDGRLLATASGDSTARLWRVPSGELVASPLRGHDEGLWDARFASDGESLATASTDGTVRLWNPSDGASHGHPLSGHEGAIYSLDFVGDGPLLATGSEDATVRLWKTSFSDWVTAGCRLVNRNLSMTEWNQVARGLPYERTCPEISAGEGAPAEAPAARYTKVR